MEKGLRMWIKAVLIILGMLLFCVLADKKKPDRDVEKEARIKAYEADGSVEKIETVLLAYGEPLPEKQVLALSGVYTYETEEIEGALYKQVTLYVRENKILDIVTNKKQKEAQLSNIWVSEVEDKRILCFYGGNYFYLPIVTERENREQIADVYFQDGEIKEYRVKKEKISGKLLSVSKEQIVLAGRKWELTEGVRIYRLYGSLEEVSLQELKIGYEDVDYVIEDGKICAGLITSEKNMETIRVLLQSGNYNGNYHDEVTLTADSDYLLQYGEMCEEYKAGEEIQIASDSGYYINNDRIILTTVVNTGKAEILSIDRSRERTDYRGSLEIIKTKEGLVIINEVLLEEYLYGVVPSEMPSSYPIESLMAQAICARTYAYGNMKNAGFPELGAHVDDSTAFQVYGNIEERAETTEAVKATKGQILSYQDKPIDAYYYSTSCGYGADLRAWNGIGAETLPYLQTKTISIQETKSQKEIMENDEELLPEQLCQEEIFSSFIKEHREGFLESDESWFRWEYEVEEVDVKELERRIMERYSVQPGFILIKKNNDYISQQPKELGEIRNLQIINRNPGGNVSELLIEGTKETYFIQTEYNIRYILNNGKAMILRMDGVQVDSPTLLPSAFISIETDLETDRVKGYKIFGGGYGHGIGMSQNGAKNMALLGMSAEEILGFFYEESEMELIY